MRTVEILLAIANWLDNSNNEALLLAEDSDECLKVVAKALVSSSVILRDAARKVDELEPEEPSKLTEESLTNLADIATAFDNSDSELLQKQAEVIDELLLTVAAPPDIVALKKLQDTHRLDELKKKYQDNKVKLDKKNKIPEMKKAVDESKYTKEFNLVDTPLSTRYCPDHAGVPIARIADGKWQCSMDKKIYDFYTGYTLLNGTRVPGGDVANQSSMIMQPYSEVFDTRQERLNAK